MFGLASISFGQTERAAPIPNPEPCGALPADMVCISGGDFLRGTDRGPTNTRPAATVWVQTFYMDKFHVTYEQYHACMKAGKCRRAEPTYPDFNHPKQPMTKVSWHDAVNYCKVQGKHLPTEAQWEKAARGTDGRTYPWGNAPATCARAIIEDHSGRSCGVKQRGREADKGKPWDVGSRPPNQYGLYDMAGNSWAWVHDWYAPSYAACGKGCTGVDPKGPCQGAAECPGHTLHIVRGGSWYWGRSQATTYYRRAELPVNPHHFGFRCAASVEEAAALTRGVAAASGSDQKNRPLASPDPATEKSRQRTASAASSAAK